MGCYKSRGFKYALLNESFSIRQENTSATKARGFKYALLNESFSIRQVTKNNNKRRGEKNIFAERKR